ncbi:hypothetical protein AB4090_08435 [Acidithiobacillus sp. IBUN Pt1247-S3]|uniref:hypothetical protein n=1 Tax=Acidithiobacillus sp. IBUN Pt1247-S3 TaxID=3166642 RepID=UPI0034E4111E
MSAQPQAYLEDAFLLALDALGEQRFSTSGSREEQDLLLYFCLQSLWQLLNNAYQGDGDRFLQREQIQQLQDIDERIVELEGKLPSELVADARRCMFSYVARLDAEAESRV